MNHQEQTVGTEMCEAQSCDAQATINVQVNAGHYGLISLSLCKDCVGKFQVEGETSKS